MKIFCERLKELRQERKLSTLALSQALKVSDSTISRWENEMRIPNIENLVAIAKFFGVTADYLLGLEDWCETLEFMGVFSIYF